MTPALLDVSAKLIPNTLAAKPEVGENGTLYTLRVKPGITGLWQVSGRNQFSYRQMCELDLEYIRQWSLWMDLTILLRTIPAIVLARGAS